MTIASKLTLQSGKEFIGYSPSWQKENFEGEVVFTTGMTGYVESLTDPSYTGQFLVFTYPLIGNYGVPEAKYWESEKIRVKGVVLSTPSQNFSHHKAQISFLNWLEKQKIPLIYGLDTRSLTKTLRCSGSTLGVLQCSKTAAPKWKDPNQTHLVKKASIEKIETYGNGKKKLIVVDCGMKQNILRSLLRFDFTILRVPYDYDYASDDFDALFLSNGPGNPKVARETITILQKALKRKKPTFGICLGSQLLSHAIGGTTYKLKFGHRGHNVPCYDFDLKKCILTSQNHGWAVEKDSLPKDWRVLFNNLNDGSIEGIAHKKDPFFAVQFHPESSPGPNDSYYLFERFYEMVR